jgi:hypothetical protein
MNKQKAKTATIENIDREGLKDRIKKLKDMKQEHETIKLAMSTWFAFVWLMYWMLIVLKIFGVVQLSWLFIVSMPMFGLMIAVWGILLKAIMTRKEK